MPAHRLSPPLIAICAGFANAAIHIEIAALAEGPDGRHTFGAAIGQTDALGIWVWADQPGTAVESVFFHIRGAAFDDPAPGSLDYVFDGPGIADPHGYYAISFDGVAADPTLIQGVSMTQLPGIDPPVVLPSGPGSALLIYTGLNGTALSFLGGALPDNELVLGADGLPLSDVQVHGWYQIPAPAAMTPLALAAACARRHRQAATRHKPRL